MEHQTSRNPFLIIPRKKLDDSIDEILENHSDNGVLTPEGALLTNAVERYYYANIPVDYWFRDMFNFIGPPIAKEFYEDIVKDVKAAFREGKSGRLHGSHGIGKSLTVCCILKRVLETGQYSGLYVNLTDIIHVMLSSTQGDKTLGREILLNTNFLVIDEVDTRFMGTENAADLFGRILEPVIRARIQNKMPTFLCSNSISVEGSFSGPLQASMESLLKVVRRITLPGGEDARNLIKSGDL